MTTPLCATLQLDGVRDVTEVAADPEKEIAGVNVRPTDAEIGMLEMLGLAGPAAPPDRGASTTKPNAATVAPDRRLTSEVTVRFMVSLGSRATTHHAVGQLPSMMAYPTHKCQQ